MTALFTFFVDRAQLFVGILVGAIATLLIGSVGWRHAVPWCKANPRLLCVAGGGVCVGAAIAYSQGERPADAIASLIGAFAGVAGAVGGALWLWEVQESSSVSRALSSIDALLGFVISSMVSFCGYVRDQADPNKFVVPSMYELRDSIGHFKSDVELYESRLIDIPAHLQIAHSNLTRRLDLLAGQLDQFLGPAPVRNMLKELLQEPAVFRQIESMTDEIRQLIPSMRTLAPLSLSLLRTLRQLVNDDPSASQTK